MDLGLGALHIPPLFTGLKVLPPASIFHLPGQEEVAGLIYFCTSSPIERARGLEHDALGGSEPSTTLIGCLRVMGGACRSEWIWVHVSHRAAGHRGKPSAASGWVCGYTETQLGVPGLHLPQHNIPNSLNH